VTRYLVRRLLETIPLIIGVIVLVFFLVHAAPGDPIALLAGDRSTAEFQDELRRALGLDRPIPEQLWRYISHLAHGDLGYSFTFQEPVLSLILRRLSPTLLLMGTSFLLSTVLGVWLGVWTAVRPSSWGWNGVTVLSLLGYSIPSFWLGEVVLLIFGALLGWFPIAGMRSLGSNSAWPVWLDIAWHLVLPVIVLTAFYIALISRLTRATMLEVLEQDYVVAARGKGLSLRSVVYRHALRNALLPVTTVLGLQLGTMVAGFVFVETVFAWPGLGRLTYEVIIARDYPVIIGLFIVISISVIATNLVADLLYAALDPRIRYD
jgi:ABC-type dipeptide/oligopeptide/nickel transport system permease component